MKVLLLLLGSFSLAFTHSVWQFVWDGDKDLGDVCLYKPWGMSPVYDVDNEVLTSSTFEVTRFSQLQMMRCNNVTELPGSRCVLEAGSQIAVEMKPYYHEFPPPLPDWDPRACGRLTLDGGHRGPVMAYMSKVDNSLNNDGSGEWFKVFESGLLDWGPENPVWAVDAADRNCGRQTMTIPKDIEPGDYLLRVENIALHVATVVGGAQYYMSCFAIKVTGGGSAKPPGVKIPRLYDPTHPGLVIDVWGPYNPGGLPPRNYSIPGPPLYTGSAEA